MNRHHDSHLLIWQKMRRVQSLVAVQMAMTQVCRATAYQMERSVFELERQILQAERAGQLTPELRAAYQARLDAHCDWLIHRLERAHHELQNIIF